MLGCLTRACGGQRYACIAPCVSTLEVHKSLWLVFELISRYQPLFSQWGEKISHHQYTRWQARDYLDDDETDDGDNDLLASATPSNEHHLSSRFLVLSGPRKSGYYTCSGVTCKIAYLCPFICKLSCWFATRCWLDRLLGKDQKRQICQTGYTLGIAGIISICLLASVGIVNSLPTP